MSEVTLADVIDSMRSYHVKFSQAAPVERVEAFADGLDAIADELEGVAGSMDTGDHPAVNLSWTTTAARIRAIIGIAESEGRW